MSENSKIEWTDHTFNPWIGCTKVSPGCANFYAETLMDTRYKRVKWGEGQPRQRTSTANWKLPLKWNREAGANLLSAQHILADPLAGSSNREWALAVRRPRVFCASLADWLDDEVPIEWLADLLALIHATPNLDWLLLTKRPENWRKRMLLVLDTTGQGDLNRFVGEWLHMCATIAPKPPDNVWIGTTVEDQTRAEKRIPELLRIPAKVRFLSCEPLLGPVDIARSLTIAHAGAHESQWRTAWRGYIDWVIAGGESGHGARPMHPDWPRSLRNQCGEGGVPFLFKQWGEWAPKPENLHDSDDERFDDAPYGEFHGDGSWIDECLCDAGEEQLYRVGKRAAGRLLDGFEHNEFPA